VQPDPELGFDGTDYFESAPHTLTTHCWNYADATKESLIFELKREIQELKEQLAKKD
jgi:hypothetical protein